MDHRSLHVHISFLNKQVEATCDGGASVSCLSEKLFDQINENHHVRLQPSRTRLGTANQMPIQIKGTVSVPIKIGPKTYDHTFYVSKKAVSDFLLELKTNNCHALFSESKLKNDRNTLVLLYRKQFSFDENKRKFVEYWHLRMSQFHQNMLCLCPAQSLVGKRHQ